MRAGRSRAAVAAIAWLASTLAAWGLDPPSAAAQDRAAGEPAAIRCVDSPLTLLGGDAVDHADTCAGGAKALAFLARYGLDAPDRIDVEIVPTMPPGYAPEAAGCFDPKRNVVLLLDHVSFERFGRWMGRPIEPAMHRAIAAHEVAHALSACHFAMPRPGLIAREYIAYVAMFATMDPALRDHALAVFPEPAWADDTPPDDADYAAEPMRFGARAWRHWLARPDPAATLREILDGRQLGGRGWGW